jgi:DNA-binding transcriptional LysR family regulator
MYNILVMPRIDQMISFCRVVELKSFSLAAEALKLSQPTISMQVKALEDEFKVKLLHREGHHILPTEDGVLVYDHFIKISALYEKARQAVNHNQNNFSGSLVIGASSGPAEYPIPILLGMFKRLHPKTSIILQVGDSIEIIDKVASQSIELGFVGTHRRDGSLVFETYMEDNLVLVVGKDHPSSGKKIITYGELCRIPLILQQPGSGATINLQEALSGVHLKLSDLTITMELGLQDSVKAAVLAGFGATIISEMGVKKEIETGLLKKIDIIDLNLSRQIYMCSNRGVPLSNLANEFLNYSIAHKAL